MSKKRQSLRPQHLSESDDEEPKEVTYKMPPKKRKNFHNFESTNNDSPSLNDNEEIAPAKLGFGNNAVSKMMNKMGYQPGKGLGANQQGRAEPVVNEMRLGRAGLGAKRTGLEPNFEVTWDSSQEDVQVEESVDWMPECQHIAPSKDDMDDWIKTGPKVTEIDNETEFCTPEALQEMLAAKSVFDELNDRDLRNARTRANPFESIKGAFFQNRAAMKMANLDAVFGFVLTDPKNDQGESVVPKNGLELFYFADVCAGPGGFTEYVLWKRNEYSAHGFGFTLRGKDDFKLDNFLASSSEYFEPYYGISGKDGDGDVTKATNLENFRNLVMKVTANKGIHLFMADGGFSVEGRENIQEILSKRLYLCQILCAFNILAVGGNLICKLFDVFTPFSAGLLYLMWRCFDKVCLHKPHTSRPANSERYVVCLGFSRECDDVREYLTKVNEEYEKISTDNSLDILEIVPDSILRDSPNFCQYLTESNDRMARRQTMYLRKYKAFARNKMLEDNRQHDIRAKCLEYWAIPDDPRPQHPRVAPNNRFAELCEGDTRFALDPCSLADENTLDEKNFMEFRFAVVASTQVTLILAMGRQCFVYDQNHQAWDFQDRTLNLNLPKDTIVLGEFCKELKDGQGKNQQQQSVLRIFDAFMLNGKNVADLPYRDRLNQVKKFCSATSREFSRPDITVAQTVEVFKLNDLKTMSKRIDKGNVQRCEKLVFKNIDGSSHVEFKKLLFLRIVRDPWRIFWSKSRQMPYFSNPNTKESLYEGKPEILADFKLMYSTRRMWTLPSANEADKAKTAFDNFVNKIISKHPKLQ